MEIERKFLIKEKEKTYPCIFDTNQLEKEIKNKGKKITQHYLSTKLIPNNLKKQIKFKANELRLRKINKKYLLTIKSKGSLAREEFEIKITKKFFEKFMPLKEKSLEKIRLKKKYKNKTLEFDYFPDYSLITMEIEFKSIDEAKKFKVPGKEITGIKKYKSKNLAK